MGFAALYPSYGCGTWFVSFESPGYPPPSSHSTKTPNTTTSITVTQPRLPRSPATTVGPRGGYSDRTLSTGRSAAGSAPRWTCSPASGEVLRVTWGIVLATPAHAPTGPHIPPAPAR